MHTESLASEYLINIEVHSASLPMASNHTGKVQPYLSMFSIKDKFQEDRKKELNIIWQI